MAPPPPPMVSCHSPWPVQFMLPVTGQGCVDPPSYRGFGSPPDLFHIRPGGVGHPRGCMPIPMFRYGIRSAGVCPSCGRPQTRPDLGCYHLRLSLRFCHKGPSEGSGDPPRQIAAMSRVPSQGCTLINQPDGVRGHPEGERRALQFGGTGSKFLRVWNFASILLSSEVGGGLSRNSLLPQRYWA